MNSNDYYNFVLAEILAFGHPKVVGTDSCVENVMSYDFWMTEYELGVFETDEEDDSDDFSLMASLGLITFFFNVLI
jgi:hypothetical protein